MEQQTANHFFPILSGGKFYPVSLGRIVLAFYASNQKELTKYELQHKTNLTDDDIVNGLKFLSSLGEVTKSPTDTLTTTYFSFSTQGSIKSLENNIEKSRVVLDGLENILDARDTSNQSLNNFIKESIIFYSEVLDYIEIKITEHFNSKTFT
ncbi:hypothetical protein [uncultured Aquimarina sp.]|uniref:hypothetical protein n=1 Tax=uncultured Aquimarina sp. TaxID=575652 RepID=UPI00261318A6|nr:hypothetical protein [uncultured Aquimarina sp.]